MVEADRHVVHRSFGWQQKPNHFREPARREQEMVGAEAFVRRRESKTLVQH
jgi:hypothetical protein